MGLILGAVAGGAFFVGGLLFYINYGMDKDLKEKPGRNH